MSIIYGAQLEWDDEGPSLVLDGDDGTRTFPLTRDAARDLREIGRKLHDYEAEGGVTRIVSDNKNWLKAMARNNPELVEVYAIEEDFS